VWLVTAGSTAAAAWSEFHSLEVMKTLKYEPPGGLFGVYDSGIEV